MTIWRQSASRVEHSLTHLLPPLFALMGRHPEGGRWVARWVARWVFAGSAEVLPRPGRLPEYNRSRRRPRPGEAGRDRSVFPAHQSSRSRARPRRDARRSSRRSALARHPRSRPPAQRPQRQCFSASPASKVASPERGPQRRCLGPRRRPRSRPAQNEDIHTCRFPFGNPTSATRGTATAFGEAESLGGCTPTMSSMRQAISAATVVSPRRPPVLGSS